MIIHKSHLYAVMESVNVFTKSILTNGSGEDSHEKSSRVNHTKFVCAEYQWPSTGETQYFTVILIKQAAV